ncbi:hypothetical protein D5S18_00890 [Nocardia panacis]|uniref:HEXXH motif domain-containing protein n=1 Tax=Nocardia panacis TaxID=2340916 RepID=A0A3A4KQ84_9NOCA|nr:HEXXH motif domain-containing protein [Nocardia panacis]RJO79863.1 hypothetical protein D5S18_00890 [Nocardia panacis]
MAGPASEIDDITADLSTGHGSAAAMAELARGLLRTRMILVRTLVAETTSRLPDIAERAGLASAYRRLAELQGSHPEHVEAALSYPHAGPWLATVLRRVRDDTEGSKVPVWADCGYLGWLTATCAIACAPEGTMTLVVRAGTVLLPGIGLARLAPSDFHGHCELEWSNGALTFTVGETVLAVAAPAAEDDPAWLPMRRVQGASDESAVLLDDLDPFRDLHAGSAPPRLTAEQAAQWQRDFTGACDLLRRDLVGYFEPMRDCLKVVVPLSAEPLVASTSHTSTNGVGAVYTTAPADPCQLALTLIHEVQHTKFNLLLDQVALCEPDNAPRYYAPWRDDPRPLPGLLHGIYAFFGVTDFWRVHRGADCHATAQAHVDFELWRRQVLGAIEQAVGSNLLTEHGRRLLDALESTMSSWEREAVPSAAKLAAAEVVRAHRTFWQVRNLVPPIDEIGALAAKWRALEPCPVDFAPAVRMDQRLVADEYRSLRLAAQVKLLDQTAAVSHCHIDQPSGDRAYLSGRFDEAARRYLVQLYEDPLRPQVWAGLALALPRAYPDFDFSILQTRAEVAAWLYRAVRSEGAEPVSLLRWLSLSQRADG